MCQLCICKQFLTTPVRDEYKPLLLEYHLILSSNNLEKWQKATLVLLSARLHLPKSQTFKMDDLNKPGCQVKPEEIVEELFVRRTNPAFHDLITRCGNNVSKVWNELGKAIRNDVYMNFLWMNLLRKPQSILCLYNNLKHLIFFFFEEGKCLMPCVYTFMPEEMNKFVLNQIAKNSNDIGKLLDEMEKLVRRDFPGEDYHKVLNQMQTIRRDAGKDISKVNGSSRPNSAKKRPSRSDTPVRASSVASERSSSATKGFVAGPVPTASSARSQQNHFSKKGSNNYSDNTNKNGSNKNKHGNKNGPKQFEKNKNSNDVMQGGDATDAEFQWKNEQKSRGCCHLS